MNSASIKSNVSFAALQSFYWSAFCMTSTFMVLYMEGQGFEKDQIGAIFSASSVAVVMGQYFWGSYCYKYHWLSHKTIILICLATGISINTVFLISDSNFLNTLLLYSLFTFTLSSMAPMIDAWTFFRKHDTPNINFGLTRGIGSGVYALAAACFGLLFTRIDLKYMFLFSSLFMVLALLVAVRIDKGSAEESNLVSKIAGLGAAGRLFLNLRFVLLFLSVLIIFVSFTSNASFYGMLITELGGDSGSFGTGIFLMALGEMLVMLISSWLLTKFSARVLLVSSFLFFLVKAQLLASADSVLTALLAQLAQSFSFGLFLPVCVVYITQIVHKSEITLAYMLISSAGFGVGGIIGNAVGGSISQHFSLKTMYEINVYITALGLGLFVLSLLCSKKSIEGSRRLHG